MKLFSNTGDGSCAYHTISVSLYEAIMNNTLPVKEKQTEIDEFLQIFATFHPNFNPATLDNLKCWLTHYAKTARDIELLLSPVLRSWFEKENSGEDLETVLQNLPERYSIHAEEDSLHFLAGKFGFNLFLESNNQMQDFSCIAPQPGPSIHIKHNVNHFDAYVSDNFFKKFNNGKDSVILSHAGNAKNAYTFNKNPLPTIMADFNKSPDDFYNELKTFQHELQKQAFAIQCQEFALTDEQEINELKKNPIYDFSKSNEKDNYIPDQDSLRLMFQLLQEDAKALLQAKEALKSTNQRLVKP